MLKKIRISKDDWGYMGKAITFERVKNKLPIHISLLSHIFYRKWVWPIRYDEYPLLCPPGQREWEAGPFLIKIGNG